MAVLYREISGLRRWYNSRGQPYENHTGPIIIQTQPYSLACPFGQFGDVGIFGKLQSLQTDPTASDRTCWIKMDFAIYIIQCKATVYEPNYFRLYAAPSALYL